MAEVAAEVAAEAAAEAEAEAGPVGMARHLLQQQVRPEHRLPPIRAEAVAEAGPAGPAVLVLPVVPVVLAAAARFNSSGSSDAEAAF